MIIRKLSPAISVHVLLKVIRRQLPCAVPRLETESETETDDGDDLEPSHPGSCFFELQILHNTVAADATTVCGAFDVWGRDWDDRLSDRVDGL
jgi:hypothetical protein